MGSRQEHCRRIDCTRGYHGQKIADYFSGSGSAFGAARDERILTSTNFGRLSSSAARSMNALAHARHCCFRTSASEVARASVGCFSFASFKHQLTLNVSSIQRRSRKTKALYGERSRTDWLYGDLFITKRVELNPIYGGGSVKDNILLAKGRSRRRCLSGDTFRGAHLTLAATLAVVTVLLIDLDQPALGLIKVPTDTWVEVAKTIRPLGLLARLKNRRREAASKTAEPISAS